jgi:hypothetical protein
MELEWIIYVFIEFIDVLQIFTVGLHCKWTLPSDMRGQKNERCNQTHEVTDNELSLTIDPSPPSPLPSCILLCFMISGYIRLELRTKHETMLKENELNKTMVVNATILKWWWVDGSSKRAARGDRAKEEIRLRRGPKQIFAAAEVRATTQSLRHLWFYPQQATCELHCFESTTHSGMLASPWWTIVVGRWRSIHKLVWSMAISGTLNCRYLYIHTTQNMA